MSLEIEPAVEALLAGLAPDIALLPADQQQDMPVGEEGQALPFVRYQVVNSPPSAFSLELGGTISATGLVQVDLMAPDTLALAERCELVRRVLSLFPRGTRLGRARIDRPAYAPSPLQAPPYIQVPVTVYWLALLREADGW